jgi:hypothetical protein
MKIKNKKIHRYCKVALLNLWMRRMNERRKKKTNIYLVSATKQNR